MPSSGYVADTFVANEQPTTSKWNELWGNDASFNSGAGFNDSILISRHFATSGLQLPDKTFNPYKFSAYRNAAFNFAISNTLITFDTKAFDTGSNYSTSTGLFTAPIAGFYQFNARASTSQGSGGHRLLVTLLKNGSTELARGSDGDGVGGFLFFNGSVASAFVQLAANDTVQVSAQADAVIAADVTTPGTTFFSGYLVSAT